MEPKEARKLVATALRSGRYKQTTGVLCRTGRYGQTFDGEAGIVPLEQPMYCCLGVACEVYQEHVGGLEVVNEGRHKTFDGHEGHLPAVVQEWLDMTRNGQLVDRSVETLIAANDIAGYGFNGIAELFENAEFVRYPKLTLDTLGGGECNVS